MTDTALHPVRRERLDVTNPAGEQLAALYETPALPAANALFAHCFTCSKDIAAATRIARALAARGIGVVRFDFTGLGNSEGDFANTHFSSNVEDLVAVADRMRELGRAPSLLVGHSLGGAAVPPSRPTGAASPASTAELARIAPSPVVELNRAVAVAMAEGPAAGLALVETLANEPVLATSHLLPGVRADLLMKLGRLAEARADFERAAALTRNMRERQLLLERAATCAQWHRRLSWPLPALAPEADTP